MMKQKLNKAGLAVRREVLGAAYVDGQLAAGSDAFGQPMQALVTEACWGSIWTRPGLTRRERSMMTLVMLVALNRGHEFKLHVLGALNNGLTADDIREVILHASMYCGLPAAVEATRLAREVLATELPAGIGPRAKPAPKAKPGAKAKSKSQVKTKTRATQKPR
jgi:4-carboxymuconolactone decarboxylase